MIVNYVNASERKPGENGTYFTFIHGVKSICFFKDGYFSGVRDLSTLVWVEIIN
jgi:hypothetical protein